MASLRTLKSIGIALLSSGVLVAQQPQNVLQPTAYEPPPTQKVMLPTAYAPQLATAVSPVQSNKAVVPLVSYARLAEPLELRPEPLYLQQDQQPSPSDLKEDAAPAEESGESLTPVQGRGFNRVVTAVDISQDGIGTGVLPEPAEQEVVAEQQWLPDGVARGAAFKCVHWRPSMICHQPLYYQEIMLERHGHDRWGLLQPIASGVRFYSTIGMIPYLSILRAPCENYYVLGHYRPGTCAPKMRDHLPWDKRAAAVETLSAATAFWAAPL